MKTHYYMASSKKEALEIAKKDIKTPFTVILYKFISKGNSLYKIINS